MGRALLEVVSLLPSVGGEVLTDDEPWAAIKEKLKELLHTVITLAGHLAARLNSLIPQEKRAEILQYLQHHWLKVGAIALAAVLLTFCCCKCCCKCCGRGRGRGGRMMKAPGRGGSVMRRSAFESNPRSYFKDLHAGRDHVF